MGIESVDILSNEFLDKYCIESSLGRSLGNVSVSKLSEKDICTVLCDLDKIRCACNDIAQYLDQTGIEFRIKSDDSVLLKIEKYKRLGGKANLCFNDLVGFRAYVSSFEGLEFPPHFRVDDLSEGKRTDDGYRAVHLYYATSNMHYPIEVQLFLEKDKDFIHWSHIYCYKQVDAKLTRELRKCYDEGKISCAEDFLKQLRVLRAVEYIRKEYE